MLAKPDVTKLLFLDPDLGSEMLRMLREETAKAIHFCPTFFINIFELKYVSLLDVFTLLDTSQTANCTATKNNLIHFFHPQFLTGIFEDKFLF